MNRRTFLFNTSIFGAGLLGAGNSAPGILRAGTAINSDSNLKLGEKPVAFTVPPLSYSFDALEPYIDAKTMEIHHDKHHGAYVTNLNKALDGHADLQAKSIDDLLKGLDSIPDNIRTAVRNNGGGHWNHSLFWKLMKKGGGGEPKGDLAAAINSAFGSFADFQAKFAAAGLVSAYHAFHRVDHGQARDVLGTADRHSPRPAICLKSERRPWHRRQPAGNAINRENRNFIPGWV